MCGIFGMISQTSASPDLEVVKRATRNLAHRGPDGEGYFIDGNLAFGHRRLAIIDLSDSAAQPMHRYRYTIIYNGELYNYLELKKELSASGYHFETNSDTEVLLAAYDCWNVACLSHFKGMWAFAIYDATRKQVFCARDRFGMKPFYFYKNGSYFCFASEIKAFTTLPGWLAKLNPETAAAFLANGQQHRGASTLFEGVQQLLPGEQMEYDLQKHQFEIHKYYDVYSIKANEKLPFQLAATHFHSLFNDSIKLHLRSDVESGVALSGGLDSSSILSQVASLKNDNSSPTLHTVTYCADDPAINECNFVDVLQRSFNIQSHRITPDFKTLLSLHEKVLFAQDEPLLSSSLLAQYAVFEAAQDKRLKVMLDGQGGDELLAGYPTYYLPFMKDILQNQIWKLPAAAMHFLRKGSVSFGKLMFKLKGADDYSTLLKLQQATQKPQNAYGVGQFDQYSRAMIQRDNLPALLHFEDRNSMAHGVEARLPFLDHALVEYCLQLPAQYKIRQGIQKSILREAMKAELPAAITQRSDKIGFKAPQEWWMLTQPAEVLKQANAIINQYPAIFERNSLNWIEGVLKNKTHFHFPFIWRLLSFGKWLELYEVEI